MKSEEIRKKFLDFFEKRGHKVIPSDSLIPEDNGVLNKTLFTTAGMQPLVPYILGAEHKEGKRLCNAQKCVRVQDIDEVGDNTHDTFFEMLGNWSLGDYFKKDSIKWSYELLTSKEDGLGLNPDRLYITVFEGNEDAEQDTESFEIWKSFGIREDRIYFMPAKNNWWSAGESGPCGPDTEIFYDTTVEGLGDMTKEEYMKADDEQKVVEIWNNVFMEYEKKDGKVVGKLQNKNVDTGAGLERWCMILQGKNNIFDTDLFKDLMDITKNLSKEERNQRIIADHIRTSVFMIADGVKPSNTDRGYVLRRLIRRAVVKTDERKISNEAIIKMVEAVRVKYKDIYTNIGEKLEDIKQTIEDEIFKFEKTINLGLKEFEKMSERDISANEAFLLFSSYGFPIELTKELADTKGIKVDTEGFQYEMKKHQELSRYGAEQKFKGGLGGTSEIEIKYHTATHLLHQALRDVLGEEVEQKGSNINPERLRFDFAHIGKMTEDEKRDVEKRVNENIQAALPVNMVVMKKEEAEKVGALHFFGDKYGDEVSVYYIGNSLEDSYSKEFCGGPHVKNTKELGKFKIQKEEAVASGIRRIKAVLE